MGTVPRIAGGTIGMKFGGKNPIALTRRHFYDAVLAKVRTTVR